MSEMLKQFGRSRTLVRFILGTLIVTGLVSCGSSNDQGVVFTLLGTYTGSDCSTGLTGASLPLGDTISTDGGAFGGGLIAALQVQNNLAGQALRVEAVNISYEVPGASSQPPSTIEAFPASLLGPADIDGEIQTSLPSSFGSVSNTACGEVSVITGAVEQYLILNKTSLPELPFTLIATITVTGVSTSGERYTTNPLYFPVVYTDPSLVDPTDGGAA